MNALSPQDKLVVSPCLRNYVELATQLEVGTQPSKALPT